MKGWRLMAAAGLVAASLLTARCALANDDLAGSDASSSDDVWSEVGWGALTGLSNLIYVPAKLVYAGVGGLTGGLAYTLTGGSLDTAQAIWEPSFGGDYFLTPGMIQGDEGISFAGAPAGLTTEMPDDEPPAAAPRSGRGPRADG